MTILPRQPSDPQIPSEDRVITLRGVTWADYQRLQEIRGDDSSPRLSYLDGTLQLMTPSPHHEGIKSVIGRLVEAWCFHADIEFNPVGSWTLEDKEQKAGAEPDECYVFGSGELDARPDLAIEVIWTSGSLDKLDIYQRLGVQEVWYWRRGRISIHLLGPDGYSESERSAALPDLDVSLLARFVDVRPVSQAIKQFRAALEG